MTDTPEKPLTADEIARIKRYVSGHRGLATPLAAEEGQSLIATIEQQAEQIEKLRLELQYARAYPVQLNFPSDGAGQ